MRSGRSILRIALVAAALAFLALRGFMHRGAASAEPGAEIRPAANGGIALGSLVFAPCVLDGGNGGASVAAFCTHLDVPENRADPGARSIALRIALVRSEADVAAHDLVVLLAGGPGQAATEVYPRAAGGFEPLRKHRNILLVDQRGTGGSHPLRCEREPTDVAANAAGLDLDAVRERTRECLAKVSKDADPAQYTTTAAVEDLEAVRAALGGPRYDLVGVSYGTRVAQQYLMRHADGVRSVVLDSAVPNDVVLGAEFARNLDEALHRIFAGCTATPACKAAFGDPYAALYRLRDRLAAKPVEIETRDYRSYANEKMTLDAATLAGLVRIFAYAPETAALLPHAIARALAGDAAPLAEQTGLLKENLADLAGSGMQLSVICAEDADRLKPNASERHLILGGDFVDAMRAECGIWPHGTRPDDFTTPVASDKPVLILEGERDPVTPPRYGEAIVKGLPNGRLLVASGQGHSVMARGCFPRLVNRFVETLDAAGLDAGCIANFSPTPAFIDYNGAGP